MIEPMQRLLAILIAGAVSLTSVAAAESCPTMRAQALERCCCPPTAQQHARLTCCTSVRASDSKIAVRDRHDPQTFAPGTMTAPWSFESVVPTTSLAASPHTFVASAAGPPVVALRI